MATYYTKQGDTGAILRVTLEDRAGPFDLTGYTVKIRMRRKFATELLVDAACVTDADQETNPGQLSYSWQAEDVETPGTFLAEFVATDGDGKEITFPRGVSTGATDAEYLIVVIEQGIE